MKPLHHRSLKSAFAATAILVTLNSYKASAAEYTWDTSPDAGIQAGSGVWGTDLFWTTDSGTSRIAWPGSSHTATFAGTAGTYTVQLSANIATGLGTATLGALNFATNGYTLQSNSAITTRTLTIGNSNSTGFITVASGITATIGNQLRITKSGTSGQLDLYGGGKLVIGSGTVGGNASLDTSNGNNTSFIMGGSTLEVTTGGSAIYGGTTLAGSSLVVANNAGGGTLLVSGGNVTINGPATSLIMHNAGQITSTSTITITSGSINFGNSSNTGGIRFGPAGSTSNTTNLTGTFNLDGGTVTTNKVFMGGTFSAGARYTAIFNFNGGTLRALRTNNTDFMTGINAATSGSTSSGVFVKSGGAVIDSNTFDITIAQALLHDPALGATADGGLKKLSTGTLTLSSANTYTGITEIAAGTLALTGTGSITNSSRIMANGTFSLTGLTASNFSVGATQSLTGSGSINAAGKTLSIAGTHSAGSSNALTGGVGTQSITGNLSYATNSIFAWDLNANSNVSGFDQINLTGNLTIASDAKFQVIVGSTVDFTNSFWSSNKVWNNIFNVTGETPVSGWDQTAALVFNTSGNQVTNVSNYGSFSITGTSLTWTAVPEPTSALAGLLIGAGLLRRRRNH